MLKRYEWGSRQRLQDMFTDALPGNVSGPLAELWFSGHVRWPSLLQTDDGTVELTEAIRHDPAGMVGARNSEEFGPVLPYLLKVISVHIPLSLQVHPVGFEARAGFNEQNAKGIAFDAFERSYQDTTEKREMLVALEPFRASIGFAPLHVMISTLALVDHPVARRMLRSLTSLEHSSGADRLMPEAAAAWPASRRKVFRALCEAVCLNGRVNDVQFPTGSSGIIESLQDATQHTSGGRQALMLSHALSAAAAFPGDVSVFSLLMMNPVTLREGESVFIPAGTLHAYIHGTAVEIMSNSDNVLRAGMTVKYKDIAHLLTSVDCGQQPPVSPHDTVLSWSSDRPLKAYVPPVGEFQVAYGQVDPVAGCDVIIGEHGPRIVVCTHGTVRCSTVADTRRLRAGDAVFVPAREGGIHLEDVGPRCAGADACGGSAKVAVAAVR